MIDKMQRFVDIEASMPDKRGASERQHDFNEIYRAYDGHLATEQSSRCEQCGIPFCQIHCPLQNNIPDWLRLATEGRMEEAYAVSQATNTFPEICGRICPQDRLCEGSCVLEQSRHGSVTIGAIEKHITDHAWEQGWVHGPDPVQERDKSVGIIGAGPAGLAAADRLRAGGYDVHIYDRYDRAGGLLIYGIPNFKLEKHIVQKRTSLLADSGVVFHQNFDVGRDGTLLDLRSRHDAVLIATGVYKARQLIAPGSGLGGVWPAMTYLSAANRSGLGDHVPELENGLLSARNRHVVVVGGGDTAMDCVRTAVRQGAASVKCLYRRDRQNMPGSMREVANAEEEGVEFKWLSAPVAFDGDTNVSSAHVQTMHLGAPDASGRRGPKAIDGEKEVLSANMVIMALGFEAEDLPTMFDEPGLPVSLGGTVTVNPQTHMTAIPGVFAAGDIVRGSSLVVWAIREGRDAANSINDYLTLETRPDSLSSGPVAQASQVSFT